MCSQYCADCHKRVKLEKPVNRPAAQLPERAAHRSHDAEPDKQREKKYLARPPGGNDSHNKTCLNKEEAAAHPGISGWVEVSSSAGKCANPSLQEELLQAMAASHVEAL